MEYFFLDSLINSTNKDFSITNEEFNKKLTEIAIRLKEEKLKEEKLKEEKLKEEKLKEKKRKSEKKIIINEIKQAENKMIRLQKEILVTKLNIEKMKNKLLLL